LSALSFYQIKLFVNHKPVNDVSLEEIQQAFHHLGAEPVTGILKWEQLRMMLMRMGESLSESEIQTAIARLTGSSLSGREDFMASTFAENVLGFEGIGAVESIGSYDT